MENLAEKKKKTEIWFRSLREQICESLEKAEKKFENSNKGFKKKKWYRDPSRKKNLGGGEISVLKGKLFEKAGVNISTVHGKFSKQFCKEIPGADKNPNFWASGISVVIHPLSPLMPAVHMNTRFIVTQKQWFGGGADITPTYKNTKQSKDLAKIFHNNLKNACDNYKKGSYKKFKKWCDEYFYLPHRKESRGLGGIFYDYLNTNEWNKDFIFTKNVGLTFIQTYLKIIELTARERWNENDKAKQLFRRSRYVEFNLLHDRGTKFGLMTNGNTEAILMSLPPLASW